MRDHIEILCISSELAKGKEVKEILMVSFDRSP